MLTRRELGPAVYQLGPLSDGELEELIELVLPHYTPDSAFAQAVRAEQARRDTRDAKEPSAAPCARSN